MYEVLQYSLETFGDSMESIDEIVLLGRLLDVLYLLQVLVHVFGVDVRHVKLVQLIALLNNYSNLIFLTYVHCLTGVIILLVIIRRFYR